VILLSGRKFRDELPEKVKPLLKTYILCTEHEFSSFTNAAKQKIAADSEGWAFIDISSSCVPMASIPEPF